MVDNHFRVTRSKSWNCLQNSNLEYRVLCRKKNTCFALCCSWSNGRNIARDFRKLFQNKFFRWNRFTNVHNMWKNLADLRRNHFEKYCTDNDDEVWWKRFQKDWIGRLRFNPWDASNPDLSKDLPSTTGSTIYRSLPWWCLSTISQRTCLGHSRWYWAPSSGGSCPP